MSYVVWLGVLAIRLVSCCCTSGMTGVCTVEDKRMQNSHTVELLEPPDGSTDEYMARKAC